MYPNRVPNKEHVQFVLICNSELYYRFYFPQLFNLLCFCHAGGWQNDKDTVCCSFRGPTHCKKGISLCRERWCTLNVSTFPKGLWNLNKSCSGSEATIIFVTRNSVSRQTGISVCVFLVERVPDNLCVTETSSKHNLNRIFFIFSYMSWYISTLFSPNNKKRNIFVENRKTFRNCSQGNADRN